MPSTLKPLRTLYVGNTRLSDSDYRVCYGRDSKVARVVYGLPEHPDGVASVEFVPMSFGEGVALSDFFRFLRLTVHLRRHRKDYDLVHFFTTKLQLLGPICAYLAGVPSVRTVNGFGRTFNRHGLRYRLLRPIYMGLTRVAIRLSEATFLQNRGDLRWLAEKLPGARGKLHWVGSGVDCEQVADKDFTTAPLQVLMVARLMPDKGIRTFLSAAAKLRSDRYRFTLVGPPSGRGGSILREVQRAHDEGSITYLGELSSIHLSAVYRSHHVFVLPSSYGEGMPRVMLEAGHALMCPVASDIPAHRDLIVAGRGFMLADPSDSCELVQHLEHLANDRQDLETNARNFQHHVVNNFAIDRYVSRLDELLVKIVRGDANSDTTGVAGQSRQAA